MNFVTFPVASTNIFPHSNSTTGGQLVSEWNLRTREMVETSSTIEYEVGPSFVHNADDFEVRILQDAAGYEINQSTLEIMPGRGVINGHFVQTHAPMTIDLLEANRKLKLQKRPPLEDELEVGVRVFYSTEPTMAGAMMVDNEYEMYLGVQLVVLPKGELILPIETPKDRTKVTAHLRLASFTFSNNKIKGIENFNEEKCKYISADRIANIDMILSDTYIKKSSLDSRKLYTFSGKLSSNSSKDTWCDSTDSLMVWDNDPLHKTTTVKPTHKEAVFETSGDSVVLVVPHKQVDGMVDQQGRPQYYKSRYIPLPVADYGKGTPGTVDRSYTQQIKDIYKQFSMFHDIIKGKQIAYLEEKTVETELPVLSDKWNVGDYILVNRDYTADVDYDGVRAPSTMYVVLPGQVKDIQYVGHCKKNTHMTDEAQNTPSPTNNTSIEGVKIGFLNFYQEDDHATIDPTDGKYKDEESGDDVYPTFYEDDDGTVGVPTTDGTHQDYFVARYWYEPEKVDGKLNINSKGIVYQEYDEFYYAVTSAKKRSYSSYILLTGETPLAQEDVIGGFYNVSTDNIDAGYVYLDEDGRLRLLDYGLLRSGVLAYQLGEDIVIASSGLDASGVQEHLDEYVNQRVAFPNTNQLHNSDNPNVINIDITLHKEENPATITIRDIDSRFNTSVYLHINGEADSNTTINIINCQKIRINNNISGDPIINVYRSCLYYDAALFNYIRKNRSAVDIITRFTGFQDIKLWYEMFEDSDPKLLVDNMTVSELDAPIIADEVDFWDEKRINDNHYKYALHSITFSGSGDIVRCGLLISNGSTTNIELGDSLIATTFELPQGSGLVYPKTCMTKPLKITGTFVSAYRSESKWIVSDTNFTAVTATYDPYDQTPPITGSIALHSHSSSFNVDLGVDSVTGWDSGTYHLFEGGVIG